MLFKSFKFEVKADREKRLIKGYASTFEKPEDHDSHGDIIGPHAFDETLAENEATIAKGRPGFVKMLWRHWEPLGMPKVMSVDSKGLYVEGRTSKTRLGDEALELMSDGVVDGLSIGFDPLVTKDLEDMVTYGYRRGESVREIEKLKLYEWSPVVWGSNPEALIESVAKSLVHDGRTSFDGLQVLRDALDRRLRQATPPPPTHDHALTAIRAMRDDLRSMKALLGV